MVIFNENKLLLLLSLLFFIFCIVLIVLFYSNFSNIKNSRIINTSSTPASGHTIIIDAGHGFPDGGATGKDGSIESEINLSISLKLQKYLEASNCIVLLTRSDENGIYDQDARSIRNKKISDMENRAELANNSNSELFISIHMNKLPQTQYSGWQTFYKNNDELSKRLAEYIQYNMNYYLEENNSRKIKSISNIYLTEHVNIPLVIVECGFLSNEKENKLLQTDSYQNKIAWCIYLGRMDYFKEK